MRCNRFAAFAVYVGLIFIALSISGCFAGLGGGTDATLKTNQLIADSNTTRATGLASAFANCRGEPGCLVGVSFIASGIGNQQFFRPRDGVDVLNALLPYANLLMQGYGMAVDGGGSGGGRGAIIINRSKDVSISGIGTTYAADHGSSVSGTLDFSKEQNPINYSYNPSNPGTGSQSAPIDNGRDKIHEDSGSNESDSSNNDSFNSRVRK